MTENGIAFSHLGIFFREVGRSINIFGLTVNFYGIIISAGMVLAGAFVLYDAVRKKQKQDETDPRIGKLKEKPSFHGFSISHMNCFRADVPP